jgi:hypothetical protein
MIGVPGRVSSGSLPGRDADHGPTVRSRLQSAGDGIVALSLGVTDGISGLPISIPSQSSKRS